MMVAACGGRTPSLTIAPGLHPQMAPADVERLAREAIDPAIATEIDGRHAPDAVSLTAIHGGSTIAAYESGTSWLVEFKGAFEVPNGGRRAGTHVARSAIVQVADDFGTILAVTFPEEQVVR